jgi:hypothetical protein
LLEGVIGVFGVPKGAIEIELPFSTTDLKIAAR